MPFCEQVRGVKIQSAFLKVLVNNMLILARGVVLIVARWWGSFWWGVALRLVLCWRGLALILVLTCWVLDLMLLTVSAMRRHP